MTDGSVLFKKLLGARLRALRTEGGVELAEAAAATHREVLAVRRWENGYSLLDPLQLERLGELYGADDETRKRLERLHSLASQKAWWHTYGKRPEATAGLLSLEGAATRIRSFDASALPGLLQTTGYARGVLSTVEGGASTAQIESFVDFRLARQSNVWQANSTKSPPREAVFLVDEAALRRMETLDSTVQRAQLGRLLTLPEGAMLQVVPFTAGPHPSLGSYVIFDLFLDGEASMQGLYVEDLAGQGGYLSEVAEEIRSYERVFERTLLQAMTPEGTARWLQEMKDGITDE